MLILITTSVLALNILLNYRVTGAALDYLKTHHPDEWQLLVSQAERNYQMTKWSSPGGYGFWTRLLLINSFREGRLAAIDDPQLQSFKHRLKRIREFTIAGIILVLVIGMALAANH
ncbi:hypothetical protein L2750_16525 [Shewanella submarina]|uniref:Uncharacterized protein n=1 Tax=Shewanella submarina TaxID=2016376 RepID=A0ABV7GCG0_9GAMM|nr:hypothetical protein [Shewanella submarina]MCL1038736.1 hypothetical protein [Shewanella submarina]